MDCALRRLFARIVDRTALRRTFSIVCAIVLLAVSIAHTVQHFDGAGAIAAPQAAVGVADDAPLTSKTVTLSLEHCFACTMTAMSVEGQPTVTRGAAVKSTNRAPRDVRPHSPATETRPPIITT